MNQFSLDASHSSGDLPLQRSVSFDSAKTFPSAMTLPNDLYGNSHAPPILPYHEHSPSRSDSPSRSVSPSARSVSSVATLPVGSGLFGRPRMEGSKQPGTPPRTDPRTTRPYMGSRETPVSSLPATGLVTSLPAAFQHTASAASDVSGAVASRVPALGRSRSQDIVTSALSSRSTLPPADLQNDPFLTHLQQPSSLRDDEGTPLLSTKDGSRKVSQNAKFWVLTSGCCLGFQTAVSGLVLFWCFDETGHRSGYEEGHLDPEDQNAGCQYVFLWLCSQACCDLFVTLFTFMLLCIPVKSDPAGLHGCIAAIRFCTLPVGFHVLYSSGLKRDLCDQPLITWSTIVVWLAIFMMVAVSCWLLVLVLSTLVKNRRQPGAKELKSRGTVEWPKPMHTYGDAYHQRAVFH